MDLKIEVTDVEIDMGFAANYTERVRLRFRRPPDSTVVDDIMGIKSRYGWKVETPSDNSISRLQVSDFTIHCVGAKSDDVGNAIGKILSESHGMKVMYSQFLRIAGRDRFTQGVERLDLEAKVSE